MRVQLLGTIEVSINQAITVYAADVIIDEEPAIEIESCGGAVFPPAKETPIWSRYKLEHACGLPSLTGTLSASGGTGWEFVALAMLRRYQRQNGQRQALLKKYEDDLEPVERLVEMYGDAIRHGDSLSSIVRRFDEVLYAVASALHKRENPSCASAPSSG